MPNKRDTLAASAVARYVLRMMKPRVLIVAVLLIYYHAKGANGDVHPEISPGGDLHIHSDSTGHLLERFPLDPSMGAQNDEVPAVGPFVGNAEMIPPEMTVRKRDCEMPSVAARRQLESSLKRSHFATTHEELRQRMMEEERHLLKKRETTTDGTLPWTCETKYEWKDMGADHYPRFVRTAECKTKFCVRGFYRCKPRRYKTKILRRFTGTESSTCEEDDVSLPETLRTAWRFITVTINLCCDCTGPGRIPGGDV